MDDTVTMEKGKKIVCLGGGIGTANLIRGLKSHTENLTVVVSTADDGGSAGRLRRLYNIVPPGDAVSCLRALMKSNSGLESKLLSYRFPGDRYGHDEVLAGHKLGSLMLVALRDITGSFEEALSYMEKTFGTIGKILPATDVPISLSAVTVDGVIVESEEKIDLGEYEGRRVLDKVSINPENPSLLPQVTKALSEADAIVAGPGDLYTTLLPVLLIPGVNEAIEKSNAKRLFVINVANKPFETQGYRAVDFLNALKKHLGSVPFDKVIINNNTSVPIPEEYAYGYVTDGSDMQDYPNLKLIEEDLVDTKFPLYHDCHKLASAVYKTI